MKTLYEHLIKQHIKKTETSYPKGLTKITWDEYMEYIHKMKCIVEAEHYEHSYDYEWECYVVQMSTKEAEKTLHMKESDIKQMIYPYVQQYFKEGCSWDVTTIEEKWIKSLDREDYEDAKKTCKNIYIVGI